MTTDPTFVYARLYGSGKCSVSAYGDPKYHESVKQALAGALRIQVSLDAMTLVLELKTRGVPDEAARAFLKSAAVDDEVYLAPHRC